MARASRGWIALNGHGYTADLPTDLSEPQISSKAENMLNRPHGEFTFGYSVTKEEARDVLRVSRTEMESNELTDGPLTDSGGVLAHVLRPPSVPDKELNKYAKAFCNGVCSEEEAREAKRKHAKRSMPTILPIAKLFLLAQIFSESSHFCGQPANGSPIASNCSLQHVFSFARKIVLFPRVVKCASWNSDLIIRHKKNTGTPGAGSALHATTVECTPDRGRNAESTDTHKAAKSPSKENGVHGAKKKKDLDADITLSQLCLTDAGLVATEEVVGFSRHKPGAAIQFLHPSSLINNLVFGAGMKRSSFPQNRIVYLR